MRNLIITTALFFCIYANCQEKKPFFEKSEFKVIKDTVMSINDKKILLKNGEDKEVEVNTSLILRNFEELDKITLTNIDKIIEDANIKAKIHCKNKYTYIPRSVRVMFYFTKKVPVNKKPQILLVNIEYTAQNSYGAMGDDHNYYKYDFNGNYIKTCSELKDDALVQYYNNKSNCKETDNKCLNEFRKEYEAKTAQIDKDCN